MDANASLEKFKSSIHPAWTFAKTKEVFLFCGQEANAGETMLAGISWSIYWNLIVWVVSIIVWSSAGLGFYGGGSYGLFFILELFIGCIVVLMNQETPSLFFFLWQLIAFCSTASLACYPLYYIELYPSLFISFGMYVVSWWIQVSITFFSFHHWRGSASGPAPTLDDAAPAPAPANDAEPKAVV